MSTPGTDPATDSGSRVVALGAPSFAAAVGAPGIVLVECWAAWCPTCRAFQPVFERAAARHPRHVFAKLDAQQEQALVSSLGVEQLPSLVLYRDGIMLFNQAGTVDDAGLDDIIAQAESLDMDVVKETIAAEQATA